MRATYFHFQLEAVQGLGGARIEERAVRRRRELDEELVPAGDRLGDGLAAAAELEDDRIPRRVAVVDGHVVLDVVAVVPDFELAGAGGAVEGRLAPDGDQLAFELSHDDQGVFTRRNFVLSHCVITG